MYVALPLPNLHVALQPNGNAGTSPHRCGHLESASCCGVTCQSPTTIVGKPNNLMAVWICSKMRMFCCPSPSVVCKYATTRSTSTFLRCNLTAIHRAALGSSTSRTVEMVSAGIGEMERWLQAMIPTPALVPVAER